MQRLFKATVFTVLCCSLIPTSEMAQARAGCDQNELKTRVNTTDRLIAFRTALSSIHADSKQLAAFIVFSGDAHNSEYPTKHDKRREFISGFEGSAGTAVITRTQAALWTDGRYFLEAEEALDCNWVLMRQGEPGTPSIPGWLNSVLNASDYVGVDESLITHYTFTLIQGSLLSMSNKLELKAINSSLNPVDTVWRDQQPAQPKEIINALDVKFAGISWQGKLANLRANITSLGAGAFVVTSLDEIAWLFNLRGSDVEYTPFFLGYAVVEPSSVRLYILDKNTRLNATPTDDQTETKLHVHLNTGVDGACSSADCVQVLEYNLVDLEAYLRALAETTIVLVTYHANYAVYQAVKNNVTVRSSPIEIDKAIKNPTERVGMKNAYRRDSAELVKFLAFLENEVKSGRDWTEVSAAQRLDNQRKTLQYNRGVSFPTIAGFGSNGAIIHYMPLPSTNKQITTDSFFLLDSGGQYLDGTTDVTRTMHYGNPSDYEKECYTRVLMSSINLAMIKWPQGQRGGVLDTVARNPLWQVGLDYRHGTGHGIGAYLSVHEGPGGINVNSNSDPALKPYEFYSDEPGYYEDGKFGIRLETVVTAVPYQTKYEFGRSGYLQFEAVTLVPFELDLVDFTLMNKEQMEWLNNYNSQIKREILPLLGNDELAIKWLNDRTQLINLRQIFGLNSGSTISCSWGILILSLIVVVKFLQSSFCRT
ncbi:xaa-Pro aminopeptidase 1-like isoform X2 [Biomphalaria glabrata]|nr:xaa-Pro aminopeptidase 1-like isoform X2 [Biomphalaria glabrata]